MSQRVRVGRAAYLREWRERNRDSVHEYNRQRPAEELEIIGIDGEGLTLGGRHLYCYIAAWGPEHCHSEAENRKGLTPEAVFEFLLAVKRSCPNSLLVGFSLGYDYSKILEGLPTQLIYELARPETRPGSKYPSPRRWNRYSLNYLKGCFTVARLVVGQHQKRRNHSPDCTGCKRGESVTVWDVWGFFQGTFISACQKWGVVTPEEYEELRAMKAKRGEFTWAQWESVKDYCGQECRKISALVTQLRQAHIDAELPLSSYYGAGSTAGTILKRMGVRDHMPKEEYSEELKNAIACSFFGGRFEISRIGPVRQKIYSYDIASAYPYQITFLPCLACGKWTRHSGRGLQGKIERSSHAIVRYSLPLSSSVKRNSRYQVSSEAWGPFPLRTRSCKGVGPLGLGIKDGNIIYPVTSGGGWVCRDEFLTGQKYWSNIEAEEAWVYTPGCSHQPFATVPDVYKLRLQWGKESRGIVVKLGPNSIYGKMAQSVGKEPPYQCFVWASMVTSGCRAQLLNLVGPNQDAILMTATDGICSTRELTLPAPRDTGTQDAADRAGKLPLGAWERKELPSGLMLIRPGIAFPLGSEQEAETKARGIGKTILTKNKELVMTNWEEHGPKSFTITRPMFFGMKSSTSLVNGEYKRSANYGLWGDQDTTVSYMPEPKRPHHYTDGRISTWSLTKRHVSAAYKPILGEREELSADALAMARQKILDREQPDYEEQGEEF